MSDPRLIRTDPTLLREATDYVTTLAFDRHLKWPTAERSGWFEAIKVASAIHGVGPLLGLKIEAGEHNRFYLATKRDRSGHQL